MYKSNYHCHSYFCDGNASLQDFAEEAIKREFKALGFTPHAPLHFEDDWHMPQSKMEEYIQEVKKLKEMYKEKLDIYTGLEVDYIDEKHNASIPYYQGLETDYMIGSIHYISPQEGGERMPIDGSFEDFQKGVERLFGGSIEKVVERFFQTTLKMVETGGFDIVGHLDKIKQNGHLYPTYKDCGKIIDAYMKDILELIAKKGMIIEVNTKSLNRIGKLYPNPKYLKQINALNIPVHVNSDAHIPSLLEDGFEEAYTILYSSGITHTCELVEGKWQKVSILSYNE